MKVLRLKLVNFIGVMHGLGKDEIEIDFTKGNHKIVMFRGGNGSGKSSIVGQITPFKQSTDNSKERMAEKKSIMSTKVISIKSRIFIPQKELLRVSLKRTVLN